VGRFASFNQLIAATTFNSKGALITVDPNDSIHIPGLTQATMTASQTSFKFS
jgi:hypothetical protein